MRFSLVAILALLAILPAAAADPLHAYVTSAQLPELRSGSTLVEPLSEDGTLRLAPAVSSAAAVAADVRALAPSVGAELLRIIPGTGLPMDSPAARLAMYNALHAVSTMKGVTYWSASRGRNRVLFLDSFAIASPDHPDRIADPVFTQVPVRDELFTQQEDSNFGKNLYSVVVTAAPDHLWVRTENLSTITFLFVPLISPHGLVTQVIVVPAGRDVLFYGAAYLRSELPLGDRHHRILSLENRLAALANWLQGRLEAVPASGP